MTSKYLNTVLTLIAVLLGLNLWVGLHTPNSGATALDPATQAYAQGRSNPSEERARIVRELEKVVAEVDALGQQLDAVTTRDGAVRVEVEVMPDRD